VAVACERLREISFIISLTWYSFCNKPFQKGEKELRDKVMFVCVNSGHRNAMARSFVTDCNIPENITVGAGLSACKCGENFGISEESFWKPGGSSLEARMAIVCEGLRNRSVSPSVLSIVSCASAMCIQFYCEDSFFVKILSSHRWFVLFFCKLVAMSSILMLKTGRPAERLD
jgi:hypothetical protein